MMHAGASFPEPKTSHEAATNALIATAEAALRAREHVGVKFAAYQTALDACPSGTAEDRRAAYLAAHNADVNFSKALTALADAGRVWTITKVV